MGLNPGGFGSNWAAIKTPYHVIKIIHTYTYICHLAHTYIQIPQKKFEMEGKNENLSPHLNMQYFASQQWGTSFNSQARK